MMKKMVMLSIVFIFIAPMDLAAFRDHRSSVKSVGSHPSVYLANQDMRTRLRMPMRLSVNKRQSGQPVHPVYPGYKPGNPGHGHPVKNRLRYGWSSGTTVVREVQPIIIVNHPAPPTPAAPPEPKRIWVPPVMGTRTEPGYWDHGIKKRWMGDHWRYEQDFETRKWVSEAQVAVIEQEGYWKFVE